MSTITTMSELLASYNDYLNESGEVNIDGCTWDRSYVLKELDPTAYRCGYLDYADSLGVDIDELENDLADDCI